MKKVLKLIFVLFVMFCIITGEAYAELSCNIELQSEKLEFEKEEEFVVKVYLSNIKSDNGVIAISTTLEYDKNILTLVEMNGQNGWETPEKGFSYNEANGKIAITRNKLGKTDEVIFEMKFKVKDDTNSNISINLKDTMIANGIDTPYTIGAVKKDITIKKQSENPTTPIPENPSSSNSTTNNVNTNGTQIDSTTNISKDNTTRTGSVLPYAGRGRNNGWILGLGVLTIAISIIYLIKIINKIK